MNHHHRFSFISCETDDSESLATPLDASPCIPLATFPIITVVPTESLLDRAHLPTIAGNRRHHDHSEQGRPPLEYNHNTNSSTSTPLLLSTESNENNNNNNTNQQGCSTPKQEQRVHHSNNLWPRIKQMMRFHHKPKKSCKEDHDLPSQLSALQIHQHKPSRPLVENPKRTHWFDKKKNTRIQPS